METLRINEIAEMAAARVERGRGALTITRVWSDTRTIEPGDLFLALRGERFDGHDYVGQAADKGAAGAMVSGDWTPPEDLPADFVLIAAADSLKAYQNLAKAYRQERPARIIGITGSNGKTSTKDMAAAAFGEFAQVQKTQGNLNNHIGVPRSLLTLEDAHQFGIFEAGMNSVGEIELLAGMLQPDVAMITNVGTAHIGMLGSREAIAREKGMLAEAVGPEGFVILSARDDFTPSIRERTGAQVLLGGIGCGDLCAEDIRPTGTGTEFHLHLSGSGKPALPVSLPVQGVHMVLNATLALAAVYALAPEHLEAAAHGLGTARLTGGRLQVRSAAGLRFLDDSYNANPDSMIAALSTLAAAQKTGKTIAVLGAMGELGDFAHDGYRRVGEEAARLGIDALLIVGVDDDILAQSAGDAGVDLVEEFSDHAAAAGRLREIAGPDDLILLKGSRAAAMEKILDNLS